MRSIGNVKQIKSNKRNKKRKRFVFYLLLVAVFPLNDNCLLLYMLKAYQRHTLIIIGVYCRINQSVDIIVYMKLTN